MDSEILGEQAGEVGPIEDVRQVAIERSLNRSPVPFLHLPLHDSIALAGCGLKPLAVHNLHAAAGVRDESRFL